MRFITIILLVGTCLVIRLPGGFIDAAVNRFSEGSIRLMDAGGSAWHGSGALMVADPVTQRWQPWLSVDWTTDFSHLWRGTLGWRLTSGEQLLAEIEISPGEFRVTREQIRGPARFFLERIPHTVGRGGWEGDVAIDSPGWRCSWSLHCYGTAEIRWYGARSNLLPANHFGDYQISITGKNREITARIDTIGNGEVNIDGNANWSIGGTLDFTGTLRGNPVLLSRLPSIAGNWVRSSGDPGVWLVSTPKDGSGASVPQAQMHKF